MLSIACAHPSWPTWTELLHGGQTPKIQREEIQYFELRQGKPVGKGVRRAQQHSIVTGGPLMAQARRRAAAAAASSLLTVRLPDQEAVDWGCEVEEAEEELFFHRKAAKGARLDESMEDQQAQRQGGYKSSAADQEGDERDGTGADQDREPRRSSILPSRA